MVGREMGLKAGDTIDEGRGWRAEGRAAAGSGACRRGSRITRRSCKSMQHTAGPRRDVVPFLAL